MQQGDSDHGVITTSRLFLRPLEHGDENFMLQLLNTPGWLNFIGDRHIHSEQDAKRYISTVLNNLDLKYQVVCLKPEGQPIGIITVIKRDYLPGPDLGFAFLPEFTGQGYAHEAAESTLQVLKKTFSELYAVTVPWNCASAALLKRLGFSFQPSLSGAHEMLNVYSL